MQHVVSILVLRELRGVRVNPVGEAFSHPESNDRPCTATWGDYCLVIQTSLILRFDRDCHKDHPQRGVAIQFTRQPAASPFE
jgi:hypothetical protein